MNIYRCSELVPECGVTFEGTNNELEELALQHAERDHGMTRGGDEMLTRVRSAIGVQN